MDKFLLAEKHVKSQREIWRKGEDYLYGNHWKGSRMSAHKSKIVINDVFEAIETLLPVITARAPKIEVRPRPRVVPFEELSQEYLDAIQEYAEGLEREFDEQWKRLKMNRKNRENFRNMKTYGNGIIKSVKKKGKDELTAEVVDIFTLLPDPTAGSIDDCFESFLIHAPIMYVHEIKRKWKVDVKPEGVLNNFRSYQFSKAVAEAPSGADMTAVSDTTEARVEQIEKVRGEEYTIEDQAQVIECWFADDATKEETVESVTIEGVETVTMTRPVPKYPFGRVVVIAPNLKDVILEDYASDYPKFPFFMAKNYSEAGSFWGRPEYKQIETLIKAENMVVSQIVDNIRLTGNPKGEKVRQAGIEDKELTNEPGTHYESNIRDGYKWQTPPGMPRYIMDLLGYIPRKKDNTTGIQDAWRGRAAGAAESGRHADILRSQTAGRIQPAVEEMVDMIRDLGDHWNWIQRNMMKETKYHQVKKPDGSLGYKMFSGMSLSPDKFPGVEASEVDFDVELSVGALLPHNRDREFEETMALVQAGYADPEMLIDAAPNVRDKARAKKWLRERGEMGGNSQVSPEDMEVLQSRDKDAIFKLLRQKPELVSVAQQLQGGGGEV